MTRFREPDISAVLQHYGLRTSWVDLVDNLFIAVWFSLNTRREEGKRIIYVPSEQTFGWINFVQPEGDKLPRLRVKDLRRAFLSLSLRPHAQHGVSITRWTRRQWTEDNFDLGAYIAAKVRIPTDPKLWRLNGFMFDSQFLFPGPDHDHTYKTLRRRPLTQLLCTIEGETGLPRGTLGRVDLLGRG